MDPSRDTMTQRTNTNTRNDTRGEGEIVIASNRGPVSFERVDGEVSARRGSGGLVSGLGPLLDEGRATWIASAMSDGDREVAQNPLLAGDVPVRLLDFDPDRFDRFYDRISNGTLWFVHHGLFDQTRQPVYDDDWWESWDAYRDVNASFGAAICDVAPEGADVLVQDYHLTLVAPFVRRHRPDLRLAHFHHTPFAGPDGLRVLAPAARDELLASLAQHHAVGFHIDAWASNFSDCQRRWVPTEAPPSVFSSTLNSDREALVAEANSAACDAALAELEDRFGDRRLIVRVDRMELSKNIVRGFKAFDLLLEKRPDLRGAVCFLACCYPSRLGVPAYARYRDEVVAAAAEINERWADGDWTPVELSTDDDYPRSVAAYRRYDVLLVNPIRDGLNLVAKEGPMVNERHGQLVLSTEAGAWSELSAAADGISPFDVSATAAALAAALDRSPEDREQRSGELRRLVTARKPADWLADQLAALT